MHSFQARANRPSNMNDVILPHEENKFPAFESRELRSTLVLLIQARQQSSEDATGGAPGVLVLMSMTIVVPCMTLIAFIHHTPSNPHKNCCPLHDMNG